MLSHVCLWAMLVLVSSIQLCFYLLIFRRLANYQVQALEITDTANPNPPPVSIIICAHNEIINLQKHLLLTLQQNYNNSYEVIVVNDASTDNSALFLQGLRQQYSHLKIINTRGLQRDLKGKKFALTQGIKAARYPHLLLSDADCFPASVHWLQLMARHFNNTTHIVLGYGPYLPSIPLLNTIIQFETVYTATQYLSFALVKLPYMGVGRNLAYAKQLFFRQKGFSKHAHVASGDDDLFINQVANATNTSIEIHPDAFCYSVAPQSWSEWFRQKQRHVSTSKHYSTSHKILLALLSASHFLFYGILIVGITQQVAYWPLLLVYAIRATVQVIIMARIFRVLHSNLKWWLIPILDIVFLWYYILLTPSLLFNKTTKWKH